jgi:demethoxyubiquinone hydroxylase (CLK1/Coq7/Cat5 family)
VARIRLADGLVPIVALQRGVNLMANSRPLADAAQSAYAFSAMSTTPLEEAMDRAERALLRIERAVERGAMYQGQDEKLRSKVAEALAELDSIIQEAGRG